MSDSDRREEKKSYANLHYPGMRTDPNEGEQSIDADARWRFAEQLACIGETAQKALLSSSAFVVSASPLGVAIARKLLGAGFGRVGVFGEKPLAGASGLSAEKNPALGTLACLSKWVKAELPWATLETFRDASIDRQLCDMMRGFSLVVSAGGPKATGEAIAVARELKLPVLAAHVEGKSAWCAFVPVGLCEDCLEVPVLGQKGLFYPVLDHAAGWVAALAVDLALEGVPAAAFVESIDASRSPWARETKEARPRPECAKCKATASPSS